MFDLLYSLIPIWFLVGGYLIWRAWIRPLFESDEPPELADLDPHIAEDIQLFDAIDRAERNRRRKKKKPVPAEPQRLSDEDKRLNRKYPYRSRLNSCLSSHGLPCRMMPPMETHQSVIYPFKPEPGVRPKQIQDMAADLAMACGIDPSQLHVIGVMAGHCVGVEIAKARSEVKPVLFRDMPKPDKSAGLVFCAGIGQNGQPVYADLATMPHLLIAGTTNAGKSNTLNVILCGLLNRLSVRDLRLILIDPKYVELTAYDGIQHLLAPISVDPETAQTYLEWAAAETERRYQYLMTLRLNNIGRLPDSDRMPRIVIVIDEIPDLIQQNSNVLNPLKTLARKGRAAGMHVIAAAQDPTENSMKGIKSCVPGRWSLQVNSWQSSKVILDETGAESLMGPGDSLLKDGRNPMMRVQVPVISDSEVSAITARHWVANPGYAADLMPAEPVVERSEVSLYDRAVEICRANPGGVSQNTFKRAGGFGGTEKIRALMNQLYENGIIGPAHPDGNKPRQVLVT